ncbi:hypothetical protein KJ758_01130 [Patescibacteria group bacterium]|nr:hypothetical protein [Patescibacteria group bacterium]
MYKPNKYIYWIPRIFSIALLLFLAMFSLDIFDSTSSFLEIVIGLLMHNIPVFVLLIVLIISWKHEIVGGIGFIAAGLLYIALLISGGFEWYMLSWAAMLSGPAFLVGGLFIIGWWQKRSQEK